jgi:L-Ala-D/L-Glu epimerase
LKIEACIECWPRLRPFRITGMTWTEHRGVSVIVRDGELSGRGECCGVFYKNETEEQILTQIDSVRDAFAQGVDRRALLDLLPAGAARNALDCALWDLEAKRLGRPVWALAGVNSPRALLTTYTIGAEAPAVMAERARAFSTATALKLKLTGERNDAERVRSVRAARPDVWLAIDANQAYSPQGFETLLPALIEARVQLIEQPFPIGADAHVSALDWPIAVAADESLQDLGDLDRIEAFDVVNLKLDKSGGLTRCLAIAREAKARGFRVMVGCMGGTSLAMAPGFVLGQLCDIVDLDGPIELRRDRTPAVVYENGCIFAPENLWGGPK